MNSIGSEQMLRERILALGETEDDLSVLNQVLSNTDEEEAGQKDNISASAVGRLLRVLSVLREVDL